MYTELERGVTPDVILLDIDFPGEGRFGGLTAARTIRRRYPEIGLIALSKHDELRIALEMMDIGKNDGRIGYLQKDKIADVVQLLGNAATVMAGGICIDGELQGIARAGGKLTDVERQIAELIARGLTNKGIADRLKIAEKTVAKYIASIRKRYGLPSPDDERRLRLNIRVLIVLAYLNDNQT